MRHPLSDMLAFPIERVKDGRLRAALHELAEAIEMTNDPDTLRALGQSLKLMGDAARSEAFSITKSHW